MSIRNINNNGVPWTRSFDTVLVKTDHVVCDQLVHPSGAVLPVHSGDGCHRDRSICPFAAADRRGQRGRSAHPVPGLPPQEAERLQPRS